MNTPVPAASRVLDLLELLARAEQGLSLGEATRRLNAPKSSTLMLLRTLVGRGYVIKPDGETYRLNPVFRKHGFGWGGSRFDRLTAVATPIMEALSESVGETVILGTLTDTAEVGLISKIVSSQDIRYDINLAKTLPAYCTAIGRVLLARMDLKSRNAILGKTPLRKITPHTVTDRSRLNIILKDIGASGVAIVEDEFALGGTGVAMAIADGQGRAIAALNVGCVTSRFPEKRKRVVAALRKSTEEITRMMMIGVPE